MPAKYLKHIKPYQGGKAISQLKRELALDNVIKLASNENPLTLPECVKQAIINEIDEVNRYPDGNGYLLKQALSAYLSVNAEQITLGNGSNDLLELIARAFIDDNQDEVIFSQYAFPIYALITQITGAKAVVTPVKNYGHDLLAMSKSVNKNTKIIFIANPNNPTGTYVGDDEVIAFLKRIPERVIVVLDQAYFEYTDSRIGAELLKEYANLIIARTFSKAYALAGLRVGYAFSSVENSDYLNRIRQPFNVNHLAQCAAVALLNEQQFLQESVESNRQGLAQLTAGLKAKKLFYIPSYTNFIAVKVADDVTGAEAKYQQLLHQGIIVRPVEMAGFLRISVGSKYENERLLNAL